MSVPLRVAVVGAGSISREFALNHFGAATGTVVSAIVDLDTAKAGALAADVGSVQAGTVVTTPGRQYLSAPADARGSPVASCAELDAKVLADCDIVYVGCTPEAHAAVVLKALRAGKHVLLEKPLASTAADADAIVTAAESAASESRGLKLGMNIGMRWNPAIVSLRSLLGGGAGGGGGIGALQGGELRLHFRQWPRAWQEQGWVALRAQGRPLHRTHARYCDHRRRRRRHR